MHVKHFFIYTMLTLLVSSFCSVRAQTSTQATQDYFKQVDQMIWVVKDLDKVMAKWRQLGFDQFANLGTVEASEKKAGKKIKIRMVQANLAGAIITWIQPLETTSVFAKFNASYGDGGMSLVYHMDSKEAVQNEVKRLNDIGIDELEAIAVNTPSGILNYVFMNTRKEGKYVLGYTFGDIDKNITARLTPQNKFAMRQNQYAFVAKDPQPISQYWQSIGMPPLTEAKPDISDKMYHGQAADYDLKQGWQKQGKVPYEWCFSLRPPNVYLDHLKQHGEGIHHLGFAVTDMDEVIRDYESKGFHFSMSGAWGEKGKPGSGRFAYVNLEDAGGVTMELLWNYPN